VVVDDDDDDDDDEAEEYEVDEDYGTSLPAMPPSVARPVAKKFKSAAAATITAGGKKKKKSPSIIKNYSCDWSELGAAAAASKKKAVR